MPCHVCDQDLPCGVVPHIPSVNTLHITGLTIGMEGHAEGVELIIGAAGRPLPLFLDPNPTVSSYIRACIRLIINRLCQWAGWPVCAIDTP
jgi:hypothetical protein